MTPRLLEAIRSSERASYDQRARRAPIAKVLVVDDDRVVAEMFRLALTRAGHEVLVANDGLAALQSVATSAPDIVFLDVRMPRMDGPELLRNLAANNATKDIPVVMLSNYDDAGLIRQTRELGAKEYMVKVGTNPADLSDIVARWVPAR